MIVALYAYVYLCVRFVQTENFFVDVLGFSRIRRPASLGERFEGAWLCGLGLELHLIEHPATATASLPCAPPELDPQADHLSFLSHDIDAVSAALREREIDFVKQDLPEGTRQVSLGFFFVSRVVVVGALIAFGLFRILASACLRMSTVSKCSRRTLMKALCQVLRCMKHPLHARMPAVSQFLTMRLTVLSVSFSCFVLWFFSCSSTHPTRTSSLKSVARKSASENLAFVGILCRRCLGFVTSRWLSKALRTR